MSQKQWVRVAAHAGTDVGKVRNGNEDDYYSGETVFAVADGMGGHVAGEVAAQTALEPVARLDQREFESGDAADEALAAAVREANRRVVEKAEAEPDLRGMGTTLTAGMLREGRLHLAHVGDSRAYLLRPDQQIAQLTTDHTLVERLVREGRLSRDDAANHPQRNVITRAIGNEPTVVVDTLPPIGLQDGDQILFCSDGLTGPVPDSEIAEILQSHPDGDEAVTTLLQRANDAGGPDNITVVLLRVDGDPNVAGADPDQAEGDTNETARVEVRQEHLRRIRTRGDSDPSDWASSMGRLGAPQGIESRPDATPDGSRRGRRVLATLLALVVLLALVGGGGWMLLSRAYFISEHEGQVAIFQGLPQEVGTIPLHRVIDDEVTDLDVNEFPEWRQERIEDGITAGTIAEARRRIQELEATLGDRDSPGDDTPTTDEPDDEDAGDGTGD